jgi:hypothetical protein
MLLKFAWLIVIYVDVLVLSLSVWEIIKTKMPSSKKAKAVQMIGLLILIMLAFSGVAWLSKSLFYHLLPLIPLLTRGALLIMFKGVSGQKLDAQHKQRTDYRNISAGLMAINFAGLMALTIVNAQPGAKILILPVYYTLLGFLGLLVVLNLQSYKDYIWHDLLGDALLESAILSMLLSIVSIFLSSEQSNLPEFYKYLFTGLALSIWLIDHLFRLYINFNVLYGGANPEAS